MEAIDCALRPDLDANAVYELPSIHNGPGLWELFRASQGLSKAHSLIFLMSGPQSALFTPTGEVSYGHYKMVQVVPWSYVLNLLF